MDLLWHLYPRGVLQQNLRASGFRLERGARRFRINAADLCHGAAWRHSAVVYRAADRAGSHFESRHR